MPQRKNTHQQHLESLIMFGDEGIKEINYKLENFIRSFNDKGDKLNITIKIDGAPAVICWHKMQGYPNDSICLKSFVNGAQNAMSSDEEISKKYGDRPNMAAMLMFCLKIAKSIPSGRAWQGDCLFTSNTKKEKEINGKQCIVFQPNKVVYSFSEDNPNYDKIKNANFGICFHTIYKKTGEGMSQSFKIDPTILDVPENIYIMSPAVNQSSVGFNTDKAEEDYKELLILEKKLIGNQAYEELVSNKSFMQFWAMFENHITSDNASTTINVSTFYNELKDFIKDKQTTAYNTKVSSLKTDKGREKAKHAYDTETKEMTDVLNSHKDILTDIVNVFNQVVKIKMDIFKYLKGSSKDYDTYLYKNTGEYEQTSGEGFSMSDQDGNIVKIVDRSEFAHANRSKNYLSGFEHESFDVKNLEHNSDSNTDKDPSVKATKEWHKMKIKKLKPGQMIVSSLQEKIVKKGSKWQVQSEKGRNMGTYDTKAEAEKRLQQVHYFKYKKEDLEEAVDTSNLISNLENIEQDNIYSEVNIIDDWGTGKDIEANYYDYDDNNVANLVVRVYDKPNRHGISFREINVEPSLQGTGFAKKLVKTCLDSIDKDDIVLVHLDFSGGFWSHMKKEFPEYNWDKTVKNEDLKEDISSFGDIDD